MQKPQRHASPGKTLHRNILLLEPEAEAEAEFKQHLRRLGHRVEAFTCSQLVAQHLTQHPATVDLVVTHPSPEGLALGRKVQALCPGLPVVLLTQPGSGYGQRNGFPLGICDVLVKPIGSQALSIRLQRHLDARET